MSRYSTSSLRQVDSEASGSRSLTRPTLDVNARPLQLASSPRRNKAGSVSTAEANTSDILKESHTPTRNKWYDLVISGWAQSRLDESRGRLLDPLALLDTFMAPRVNSAAESDAVRAIVENARVVAKRAEQASRSERKVVPEFVKFATAVVSNFDDVHRPFVEDGQDRRIDAIDERDHGTGPDVLFGLPGRTFNLWHWRDLSHVAELKTLTDIFDDKEQAVRKSRRARDALTQTAKSARSLLMRSHRTHVWVTTIHKQRYARIFCFDRTGFVASKRFDWIDEPEIFATLYYRLFHPPGHAGRIDGDDFTIERLSDSETDQRRKARLFAAIQDHEYYKDEYLTLEEITDSLLAIRASRRDEQGTEREVTCLAFGDLLSQSDSLFSRATVVYRVIIEEDLEERQPGSQVSVYALKDAWRESCRQPEADFYDTIARYCREEHIDMKNMAQCHGSVDVGTLSGQNNGIHTTRFLRLRENQKREDHLRVHVRTLLTPVGMPLNKFPSIQSLVGGLHDAMEHHRIAFKAGVVHRDASEGNVLLVEATPRDTNPRGILMDYDYAEFTEAGAKAFNDWIEENGMQREPVSTDSDKVDKKLKDITGTRPFMAIEILEAASGRKKPGQFRDLVNKQNPPLHDEQSQRVPLQHDSLLSLFKTTFEAKTWTLNDNPHAAPFEPPPSHPSFDRGRDDIENVPQEQARKDIPHKKRKRDSPQGQKPGTPAKKQRTLATLPWGGNGGTS
uniref:Fungal-type protein kinase domain-containing protein n=1 Tax=Mycena chlorophos TaxID=658473 RepID=A0ABQ0LFD8_MYCCL|nr:predicted protein [Mycena chlorophos]